MTDKTIKVEDRAGNVIELRVKARERQLRRLAGECLHHKITVDPTLNTVHCNSCGKDVVATAWIHMLIDHWDFMRYQVQQYKQAMADYEDRKRCRCQHCGKVTPIVHDFRKVRPIGTGVTPK